MKKVKLKTIKQGHRFKYGEKEFVKLDTLNDGCLCLATNIWFHTYFDRSNSNNWATSSLRKELTISVGEFVSKESLIPFNRDLTTDDGLTDYGTCTDVVSLLTCNEYRKYRKFIPNCDKWHWTITGDSLEYPHYVRYISSTGNLYYDPAYGGCGGVRPLCVLKSDTTVEEA